MTTSELIRALVEPFAALTPNVAARREAIAAELDKRLPQKAGR
jgi:hypothetical protein